MLLSEDYIEILDEILRDDTALYTETKEQELLVKLRALSSAEESSGGGGGENLTPKKRKKASGDDEEEEEEEEEDATGQQQQQQQQQREEEDRSAYFKTVEDAFEATIQEFDENDEVKRLAFLLDFVEFKANENESSREFLARLKGKSVKMIFTIKAGDGENQKLRFDLSDLTGCTKSGLGEKIRQTFGVGSLVDIINDKCGAKPPTDKRYIPGLVKSRSYGKPTIKAFPPEPSKAAAVVVSGESGSGKSAFVQFEFGDLGKNTNRDKWACIYHSIDDCDVELIQNMLRPSSDSSSTSDSKQQQGSTASQKLAKVLLKLVETGHTVGDLYDHFSTLHYNVMAKRNKAAVNALEAILLSRIENHQRLKSWWNGNESGVNKLVLVIDEAGKDPPFARGLVDSVRKIHSDWQRRKRCKDFKLVLAGSGLEGAIKADSLQIDNDSRCNDLASFGTDPMKSNVIALEGPSKENLKENLEKWISLDRSLKPEAAEAIAKGVYSRVLATNSRMLFDGVLPMLENKELTYGFTGDRATELQQRLLELCSTNVVMDYAVRTYVDLNGLGRLKESEERRHLLEKSFRFLLEASYAVVKKENKFAFDDVEKNLEISSKDKLLLRQLGLVASNPLETSSALRYLACEGHSVELIQSDGRSFEALVAAHLRRFEHVVRGFPTVQTHDLNEAWPPRMSKACKTREDVEKNFRERFAEHVYTDVTTICNQLCKEKKKLAIVMQQRVPTAQSADFIVLESVWSESGDSLTLTLDLYQAKHYQDYRKKEIREWAWSLGISMPLDSASSPHMSAHYSDLGIRFFLEGLKQRLVRDHDTQVGEATIRNRVLVVSATREQTKWNAPNFQAAKDSGLKIWTRENLEPTFSAITRGDDGVLATENEIEENWGQHELVDFFLVSEA